MHAYGEPVSKRHAPLGNALSRGAFLVACVVLVSCTEAQQSPPPGADGNVSTPPPGSMSMLVEPDQGIAPVYRLIAAAQRSIDVTMYELADPVAEQSLEQAAARGVVVRVVLDKNREQAANQPAYDDLKRHGVQVAWASARFPATHQKSIVIDHSVAAVMSLNLTSRYYGDTRDFALLDSQTGDVEAIERIFDADFRHASVATAADTDLVWSPGSEDILLSLVQSARSRLFVENEEMALPAMTDALGTAARRGVRITVVMTRQDDWSADFDRLARAGVDVRTYAGNASLYIHAKVIVADAGTPHARAFVGSENFSATSLQRNRELGLLTADPTVVATLAETIASDAAHATAWRS